MNTEKQEAIDRMIDILKSHGIEMCVWGCGCCGSPAILFEYKGETIYNGEGETVDTREKR